MLASAPVPFPKHSTKDSTCGGTEGDPGRETIQCNAERRTEPDPQSYSQCHW